MEQKYKTLTHIKHYAEFTVQCWCFDQWALSSARPSHCADRPLWSETSAGPVSTADSPAEKQAWKCYNLAGETWLQRHKLSVLTQSYHGELVDLLPQSRALVLHSDVLVLLFYLMETHSGSGLLCSFTKMQSMLFNQFSTRKQNRIVFSPNTV